MKRLRVLQILNFWRLIPAYMCICMAPVEVKHNAIIAANAAVVKDVRENEVVGGVPAKTIGENVEHKLYFGENEGIRK